MQTLWVAPGTGETVSGLLRFIERREGNAAAFFHLQNLRLTYGSSARTNLKVLRRAGDFELYDLERVAGCEV